MWRVWWPPCARRWPELGACVRLPVRSPAAQRSFDLLVALLALLLLSPLALGVALAVRLGSPGPVLFRQQRVGQHGRLFTLYKLRSMVADAPARGLPLTVGADPRITRLGAWLRRTRLDELPQLLNVLRGDMSLVGPRPEVPRYVALYPAALRERVLALKPGLTDPASLAFLDEAAQLAAAADPEREYVQAVLPHKLKMSADYGETATLASDLRVLWRTLRRLLASAPAG